MLRTDYLYYFLAVAQTNSINAAAQQLNVTPPAVSHALKNLERDLNLTLLTRTPKGVTLTEDGMIVAQEIQAIVSRLDNLENIANELALQHQKAILPKLEYLTLFSEASIFDAQLPAVSRKLYEQFPDLDLIVAEQPLNKTVEELKSDSNAIALLLIGNDSLKRINTNYKDICVRSIDKFKLTLLMRKNSKYLPKDVPKEISYDKISKYPLIKPNWISSAKYTYDTLNQNNVPLNYVAVAPTLSVLNSFLENDIGVCLGCEIPFMNLKGGLQRNIHIPIVSEQDLHIEYCLLYNKNLHPALAEAIYAYIVESYNESTKYALK